MERCYIFKDGIQQASTATRESARGHPHSGREP